MIEPIKGQIPGVHADEGAMYKFGDAGYVTVYADGHVRFVAYAPEPGVEVSHSVNHSDRPGEQVLTVKPKSSDTHGSAG